ncbi:MAG: DUF3048 domain-containing protein [Candidatus Saccharimonadales bacterium]
MEPTQKLLPANTSRWSRIHDILMKKRGLGYFLATLMLIVLSGAGVLAWMWLQPESQEPLIHPIVKKVPEPPKYFSPLTGALVADDATTKRHVTAVMIENSPDARPQSGLKDAGIVYEAIAEGGITRFLALYQESRPGLIGPVRSVRPYYVEWAAAYDPSVAHIGGSAHALSMIRSGNYGVDIDQFFNPAGYWRASDRRAPHNVYTDFDKLDALTASKGKTTSTFTPLERKEDKKSDTPNASQINLPISSAWYNVDYRYDATSNSYLRNVGGEAHMDREGGQLQPKTVVALLVGMTREMEDGYREQITTTGTGKGFVFQDGIVTEVTWQRDTDKSPLKLLDASGAIVPLNRGQTWITAMPSTRIPTWQ